MTILEPAESFKTMKRPGKALPLRCLTAYFSESIPDKKLKFCYNLH